MDAVWDQLRFLRPAWDDLIEITSVAVLFDRLLHSGRTQGILSLCECGQNVLLAQPLQVC